jgi:cephalosporin hydroxylase
MKLNCESEKFPMEEKPDKEFERRNRDHISRMVEDPSLKELTKEWFLRSSQYEYSYHFSWLGRPIIQFPTDIMAMQEIIWKVKPDLIVETGVAHGGSVIFYASMLELLGADGRVVGIDIEIREHNRREIEKHPLSKRITLVEGSSIDEKVATQVYDLSRGRRRVIIALDSKHTHDHVLKEMNLYSPLVKKGSYLVVFDTIIEDMPDSFSAGRPWSKGNNPKTAAAAFMKNNDRFVVDREIGNRLLITVAPDGYLRCVKD